MAKFYGNTDSSTLILSTPIGCVMVNHLAGMYSLTIYPFELNINCNCYNEVEQESFQFIVKKTLETLKHIHNCMPEESALFYCTIDKTTQVLQTSQGCIIISHLGLIYSISMYPKGVSINTQNYILSTGEDFNAMFKSANTVMDSINIAVCSNESKKGKGIKALLADA